MTPEILEDMRIAVESEGTTRVKRAWERFEAALADEPDEAPTGAVYVDGQWVEIE